MASSDDCGHIRFFSFSLIEGYISLVMDVQTQQRWAGPCLDITGGGGGGWSTYSLPSQFTPFPSLEWFLWAQGHPTCTARWCRSGDWDHSPKAVCPQCLTPSLSPVALTCPWILCFVPP